MKNIKLIAVLIFFAMIGSNIVLNAKIKEKEYTFYMYGAFSKNPKDILFGLVEYVETREYKGKITIQGDKITAYCMPEEEKQEFEEEYKKYLKEGISSIEYHRTKPKERKNRRSIIEKGGNYFYPWLRFTTYRYGEKGFFEAVKNRWLYKNQYVEIKKEAGDRLLGEGCKAEEIYPRDSAEREKLAREIYANSIPHLPDSLVAEKSAKYIEKFNKANNDMIVLGPQIEEKKELLQDNTLSDNEKQRLSTNLKEMEEKYD